MVATRRYLTVLLLLTSACAHPRTASSRGPRVPRNPNVISAEELWDPVIASMDALRAIRYLRPAFFRTTGPQSFSMDDAGLVKYSMDFGPVRPIRELATLTPFMLVEVRYLDANEAQLRFGLNANGGPVIVLLNNKQ